MNVLVIPEDFRNDQYVLKPLIERVLRDAGRPTACVRVCRNPRLGRVDQALNPDRLEDIVRRYDGMTDLFILCVDRDGEEGRRRRLDRLEREVGGDRVFLAENAWEEIETWALAGLALPGGWRWKTVRAEVHVKERYFEVLARERGVADGPGGGRKALGAEAARRVPAIRRKCPRTSTRWRGASRPRRVFVLPRREGAAAPLGSRARRSCDRRPAWWRARPPGAPETPRGEPGRLARRVP